MKTIAVNLPVVGTVLFIEFSAVKDLYEFFQKLLIADITSRDSFEGSMKNVIEIHFSDNSHLSQEQWESVINLIKETSRKFTIESVTGNILN